MEIVGIRGPGGGVLQQAARIAEARFARPGGLAVPRALNIDVEANDPITGSLSWNSGDIPQGTALKLGYIFGYLEGESFYVYVFSMDGVQYVWGSRLEITAPSPQTSRTDSPKSYALGFDEPTTVDAMCFIGRGILGVYNADLTAGSRVIGLNWSQFSALTLDAIKVFQNVMTVHPETVPPPAAEITGFTITKA